MSICELYGEKPLQYCWPSPSSSWMIHSDPFEALVRAMGCHLVVIRNGSHREMTDTTAEMNYFEHRVLGERASKNKNWFPHWRAQGAIMKEPKKSRELFLECFGEVLKREQARNLKWS